MTQQAARHSFRYWLILWGSGIFALIFLLPAIYFAISWRRNLALEETNARIIEQIRTLNETLEPEIVNRLAETPDATDSFEYKRLENYFQTFNRAFKCKSIWSLAIINDKLVFGPNVFAENDIDKDNRELEKKIDLEEEEIRDIYRKREPIVKGPKDAREKTIFSAAAPIIDQRTGEVRLILGMNFCSAEWSPAVQKEQYIAAFCLILPAFFIFAGFFGLKKRQLNPRIAKRILYRYWEIWTILGFGLSMSIIAALVMFDYESRNQRNNFHYLAEIKTRMATQAFRNLHNHHLGSLARFYEGSNVVEYQEFKNFTKPIIHQYPIQALSWIQPVPEEEKKKYENQHIETNISDSDFQIWEMNESGEHQPATGRETLFPIWYLQPLEENRTALGFDYSSEAKRFAAVKQAINQKQEVATDLMTFVPDPKAGKGIAILQPVFYEDTKLSEEKVQDSLRGLVMAAIRIEPFLKRVLYGGASPPTSPITKISLHQIHADSRIEKLADNSTDQTVMAGRVPGKILPSSGELAVVKPFFMFGKVYLLQASPGESFIARIPIFQWLTFLIGGTLLTTLIALFTTYLINNRNRLEEKVNERTEELRATLYSIGDGVIVTDDHSRISHMNPVAEKLTCWSEEEAQGRPLSEVFIIYNEQTMAPAPDIVSRVLREGVVVGLTNHTILVTRDKTKCPIADSAAPIHSQTGEIIGVVLVFRDQSKEKEARKAIEESERKYRQINRVLYAIREINQLIVREHSYSRLIHNACDILIKHRDYESAMIILTEKDQPNQIKTFAASGIEMHYKPLADLLNRAEIPSCCKKAGELKTINVFSENKEGTCNGCPVLEECRGKTTLSVSLLENGSILGYLSVTLGSSISLTLEEQDLFAELTGDLTYAIHSIYTEEARVQSEEEKKMLEKQLHQAQKMEAVGRLAGGVAHDFNNMLAIIMGNTEMAIMQLEENKSVRQELETIADTANRSADLTQQLLAFARKQNIEPKPLELNEALNEMLKMLRRLIGENITLNLKPSDQSIQIKFDPSQLNQILANLIVNSRDAITENSGEISIEIDTAEFVETRLGTHFEISPGSYALIAISDNGSGISKTILPRIFEPFFTTKKEGEGTGLGLPTVYGIVKQNEGFINVYSEPEKGTTFRIYIPLLYEENENSKNTVEKKLESAKHGSETILLVEDEIYLLELTEKMLTQLGYKVLSAENAGKAIQISKNNKEPIELLLTDVILPESNGRELREKISKQRPGIKCLFISGYTANAIAKYGILENNINFLEKPFTKNVLGRKVREVLDDSSET